MPDCTCVWWKDFCVRLLPAIMIGSMFLMVAGMAIIGAFSGIMTHTGSGAEATNSLSHWSYQLADLDLENYDPDYDLDQKPDADGNMPESKTTFKQWQAEHDTDIGRNGYEAFHTAIEAMKSDGGIGDATTDEITATAASETQAGDVAKTVADWNPSEYAAADDGSLTAEEQIKARNVPKQTLAKDAVAQIKSCAEEQLKFKVTAGTTCMAVGGLGAIGVTTTIANLEKGNVKPYAYILAAMITLIILFSVSFTPKHNCQGMMIASLALMGALTVVYTVGWSISDDFNVKKARRLVAHDDNRCRLVTSLKSVKHRRLVTLERLLDEINAAKEASLQREIRSQMK